MPFGELIRELFDCRIGNTDGGSLRRENFHCFVIVAEGEYGLVLFALRVDNFDATERGFFGEAEAAGDRKQKEYLEDSAHSLCSIADKANALPVRQIEHHRPA